MIRRLALAGFLALAPQLALAQVNSPNFAVAAYVRWVLNGNVTIGGNLTVGGITGSTQCLQANTSGAVSGTGSPCGGSGSTGANPTATASNVAVNGVASTFMRSDAAPAVQLATAAQKGVVQVDGTTITVAAGVISSVGGGSLALASGQIFIGSAGGLAAQQTMSGDCTISIAGAIVCTKTNGVAFGALATATPGTGVATALGVNVGTAGAFVVNGGALGTPSSGTLTNAAGLPISTGVSGLGAGIASWLATPSSANLATALTDETGTGAAVFGTAPTISSPTINTAATLGFITGSTQCLQVNTSGVVSGTGAVCGGSGSSGANPTATAADIAVNGVATTFMRSDAAPAVQKASASQFGIVEVDGATIVSTAGVISFNAPINAQVGTSYTVVSADKGKIITLTNAAAIAVTIPIASTAGFGAPFYTSFINEGTGLVTLTPTTSTIDGGSSLTIKQGQSIDLVTNGTNYFTLRGRPTNVAPADLVGLGTGVATALGTNLSAAGGVTSTIASGTSALGTSAIASATCATVVTTAATNVATTDVVTASFNGDPTAVTGYIPLTAGMLTIVAYPTANNVNFKVCNNTSASITPGAITLNWRVAR